MIADYTVILDSCVLLPMLLVDTLLRLAETPRLYVPKWTEEIMQEVSRNLHEKWNKTPEQIANRSNNMRTAFPDAWVSGYESLTACMTNDPKDRHVLAAAVRCGAELIVTYNRKHFPAVSLEFFNLEVQGPSTFLRNLYDLHEGIVSRKLNEQAAEAGLSLTALLRRLHANVPDFVSFFCQEQNISLNP